MSNEKVADDIGNCVRNNIDWQQLPVHLQQLLHNNRRDYEKYVFNYSLKNQLRFRGNLAHKVFRYEQRYYELLVQKSINCLCLFPYHLSDIVTKGLRVTPFNYYLDVLSNLLRSDKSYDTLPNFTAADCLRVLGIGRNEYLSLISDMKTHSTRALLFSAAPNPLQFLPRFPQPIHLEPWWRLEVGYVLENDIRFVSAAERSLIDDLIDFGGQTAGNCDKQLVLSLYRKGLVYVDVPISGADRICIPPLRNFVMNRVCGDYFEQLLYKIFVSADEHMSIAELAQMLQLPLDSVKQAVSLFCRLGFARRKREQQQAEEEQQTQSYHASWATTEANLSPNLKPQITPLNYKDFNNSEAAEATKNSSSNKQSDSPQSRAAPGDKDNNSSDEQSDFSFAQPSPTQSHELSNAEEESSEEPEDLTASPTSGANNSVNNSFASSSDKRGKRIAFLFDSTLTAFLMMGNLSPGLKNHAVTMFEVGKLCEESMDTLLAELEKVSLLDAEGEGDVSRYFAHAIILRSTICALRNLRAGGLDLLRLECLESLDARTRQRVLEKKYEFIISATPLAATLSQPLSVPFFGQYYRSTVADCAHMWTRLFYNHISGYGPPTLLLCKGSVLKTLPRLLLGYGKLLVSVQQAEAYVLSTEQFRNVNEQLKQGCVLLQGYGIRAAGQLHYAAFPFEEDDEEEQVKEIANETQDKQQQQKKSAAPPQLWSTHKAVLRLRAHIELKHTCGYITFVNTGVPDIGCDLYDPNVCLVQPKHKNKAAATQPQTSLPVPKTAADLLSPTDSAELTSFARPSNANNPESLLKSPDENYFAASPEHSGGGGAGNSPSNVYTSADCNELLASELAKCQMLQAQSSVEIPLTAAALKKDASATNDSDEDVGDDDCSEEWTLLDVNFGVPLFDVDCNTRICQQLVKRLSSATSSAQLQALPELNAAMNERLLRFVKQCLYFEHEQPPAELTFGKQLPQPRINLAFENGRVCYWGGR